MRGIEMEEKFGGCIDNAEVRTRPEMAISIRMRNQGTAGRRLSSPPRGPAYVSRPRMAGWHAQQRPSLSHSSQGAPGAQSTQSGQSQAGVQKRLQPRAQG